MSTKKIWEVCEILAKISGLKKDHIFRYQTVLIEKGLFKISVSKKDITTALQDCPNIDNSRDVAVYISGMTGMDESLVYSSRKILIENSVFKLDLNDVEKRLVIALLTTNDEPRTAKGDLSAGRWFIRTVGGVDRALKVLNAVKVQDQAEAKLQEMLG